MVHGSQVDSDDIEATEQQHEPLEHATVPDTVVYGGGELRVPRKGTHHDDGPQAL